MKEDKEEIKSPYENSYIILERQATMYRVMYDELNKAVEREKQYLEIIKELVKRGY